MRRLHLAALTAVTAFGAFSSPTVQAQSAKTLCTDSSRECLVSIATAYLDSLVSHDGSKLPLASDVRRTENGLVNANGEHEVRDSFKYTDMVKDHRNVKMVADTKTGEVTVFFQIDISLKAPASGETKAGDSSYKVAVTVPSGDYTVHEAERFKIEKGLIKEIQIIAHVQEGANKPSGWPD